MSLMKRKRAGIIVMLMMALILSTNLTGCDDMDYDEEYEEEKARDHWWDNPAPISGTISSGGDYDWWCLLDDSWTEDDWEYTEDGLYMIYDEETACYYLYDEESQEFAAMDEETEEIYLLDLETGEWIPLEE